MIASTALASSSERYWSLTISSAFPREMTRPGARQSRASWVARCHATVSSRPPRRDSPSAVPAVPGELVHHQRTARLEPVLGYAGTLAIATACGRGVRLEPPRTQPHQLMISRAAEPVSGAADRDVGSDGQLDASRHAIPVPNPAARLADSLGRPRAEAARPGPRRPIAASSASISSAAASAIPASAPVSYPARAARAGLGIPALLGVVERSSSCAQPVQPRLPVAADTGSRPPGGSSPRPGRGKHRRRTHPFGRSIILRI
jgi:hypothetical protein